MRRGLDKESCIYRLAARLMRGVEENQSSVMMRAVLTALMAYLHILCLCY